MARVISRGEVWITNLDPGIGREIHKKRPALIVSVDSVNKGGIYAIIVPTSSIVPRKIGQEMVVIENLERLKKTSVLLPIFVRSIDQDRLIEKVGVLQEAKFEEVEEALKLVLGLDPLL